MIAKARSACGTWRARRRSTWEKPADFFAKARGRVPATRPCGSGELYLELHRAHAHQPGRHQAGQPAQRAPAARGGAVGGDGGRARPGIRLSVRASWTASGRRCCCTSSTTSCPARPSPGCTARPRETYAAVAAELDGIIDAAPARAGRRAATRRAGLQLRAAHPRRGRRAGGARPARSPRSRRGGRLAREGGGYVLDNGLLRVEIDARGLVVSAYDIDGRPGDRRARRGRPTCSRSTRTSPTCGTPGTSTSSTATPSPTSPRPTRSRCEATGGASVRVVRAFGDSRLDPGADARARAPAPGHRHRGRLARDGEVPQGGVPAGRARRAVRRGDPVRPLLPAPRTPTPAGRRPSSRRARTASCTSRSRAGASPWSTTRRTATT